MSVSTVPRTKQTSSSRSSRKKCVSLKRRKNQNAEISELASLVPLSVPALVPPSGGDQAGCLVPSDGCNSSAIDKISVLRLVSSFLKLQQFIKDMSYVNDSCGSTKHPFGLIEEAMDGFLIVLDKEANILYISETIIDSVGLRQQDVIGQNLVDITHPTSSVEITDGLKPSVTLKSSVAEDSVFSQFRQFYVRFKSTVYNSRITSHMTVEVSGNLKVKLPPSNSDLEIVEPSVIGFIGECRRVESGYSALDMVFPITSFTWTKTLDRKIISIDENIKDIIGYDRDVFHSYGGDLIGPDLVHPADFKKLHNIKPSMRNYILRNGHLVSPIYRILNSSGDWVWMTTEVTLCYKSGTNIPHFLEFKGRVLRQGGGKLKYAVQRQLYTPTCNPGLDSVKDAKLPDAIFEEVLRVRMKECALNYNVKKLTGGESVAQNSTGQAVVEQRSNIHAAILNSLPISAAIAHDPSSSIDAAQSSSFPHSLNGVGLACSSTNLPGHNDPVVSMSPSTCAQSESTASSPITQISASGVSCSGIDKSHDHTDWDSGSNSPSNLATSSYISTGFSPSNFCTDYHSMDTIVQTAEGTDSSPLATSTALVPVQDDSQALDVSPQGFYNFTLPTNFDFPTCTFPYDAPDNPKYKYVTNLEESVSGTQNLMFEKLSDPVMQQVLDDMDIMGDFNFNASAVTESAPCWNKSMESTSHANSVPCSAIPEASDCLPQSELQTYLSTNKSNHEIQDILQQFV